VAVAAVEEYSQVQAVLLTEAVALVAADKMVMAVQLITTHNAHPLVNSGAVAVAVGEQMVVLVVSAIIVAVAVVKPLT
jgi:hypothetical protein